MSCTPIDRTSQALRPSVALWSLAGCSLLLLVVWMTPQSVHAQTWFPSSLHFVSEMLVTVIAALVFAVTWNGFRREQPLCLTLLGCLFLAIALLDVLHALSYEGMPDLLTPASPEKAINFWLVLRLLLSLGLLGLALYPCRQACGRWPRVLILGVTLIFVALVGYLGMLYPERWPSTFLPSGQLTPFKIGAEWLMTGLLLLAALGFWRARAEVRPYDAQGLMAVSLLSALAGICFASYTQVNGLYSLLGHLFNMLAYAFVYQMVVVSCLRAPYERLEVEMAERIAAERRAEKLTFYDGLTGLPNAALLRDRADQALAVAKREGSQVALLLLDLDQFKLVNDALGHTLGDQLLTAVSQLLQTVVPSNATVCRSGGDEFVILLPGLTDARFASGVIERIFDRLSLPLAIGGQPILSSASIGVAIAPSDGKDVETLLRNAEAAMYEAKDAGRKAWRYYDPAMNMATSERLQVSNGLRNALARGELELHYQLQLDLASGRVVGAEALVRWRHPQWGLVSPARFIPVAEETGLIVSIGAWIIREACCQAAEWRSQGIDIPVVAVNIAALQLQDPALVSTVAEALATVDLPAEALELELTESGLIQDNAQVKASVEGLKALGCSLAIDDFGTGYSCLAYLSRLHVDLLKIDQSFVRDLKRNADGGAIVAAIIQIARSLGLKTLAEGVEDQETAQALRQLGCHHVQGYLYGRPAPAENLTVQLAARRVSGLL